MPKAGNRQSKKQKQAARLKQKKTSDLDFGHLHPNSRKYRQAKRFLERDDNKKNKRAQQSRNRQPLYWKLKFFQSELHPDKKEYSITEICDLIEVYLQRYDEELEEIRDLSRESGRPIQQGREDTLVRNKEEDAFEYNGAGFEVPDLTSVKNVKRLRDWDGEERFMSAVKLRRFNIKQAEKARQKEGRMAGDNGDASASSVAHAVVSKALDAIPQIQINPALDNLSFTSSQGSPATAEATTEDKGHTGQDQGTGDGAMDVE